MNTFPPISSVGAGMALNETATTSPSVTGFGETFVMLTVGLPSGGGSLSATITLAELREPTV